MPALRVTPGDHRQRLAELLNAASHQYRQALFHNTMVAIGIPSAPAAVVSDKAQIRAVIAKAKRQRKLATKKGHKLP